MNITLDGEMLTFGVNRYCCEPKVISIDSTTPRTMRTVPVAASSSRSGALMVMLGGAVYPLPPFVTAIDVIEKPVLTVAVPVAVTPPSVCGAENVTVGEDSSCSVTIDQPGGIYQALIQ